MAGAASDCKLSHQWTPVEQTRVDKLTLCRQGVGFSKQRLNLIKAGKPRYSKKWRQTGETGGTGGTRGHRGHRGDSADWADRAYKVNSFEP